MEIANTRNPGAALDVGMGPGRNSIWLAQRGWAVTGLRPRRKGRRAGPSVRRDLGLGLKTEIRHMEDFDFGERRWDLILLSYAGGRERAESLQRALKPGGVLVTEAFHRDATRDRRWAPPGSSIRGSCRPCTRCPEISGTKSPSPMQIRLGKSTASQVQRRAPGLMGDAHASPEIADQ